MINFKNYHDQFGELFCPFVAISRNSCAIPLTLKSGVNFFIKTWDCLEKIIEKNWIIKKLRSIFLNIFFEKNDDAPQYQPKNACFKMLRQFFLIEEILLPSIKIESI